MPLISVLELKSPIYYSNMNKRKRPITAGHVVFEVLFILSYPFIAAFSVAVTVLVWIFSLPSRLVALFSRK